MGAALRQRSAFPNLRRPILSFALAVHQLSKTAFDFAEYPIIDVMMMQNNVRQVGNKV
jgi:hypothetical protein